MITDFSACCLRSRDCRITIRRGARVIDWTAIASKACWTGRIPIVAGAVSSLKSIVFLLYAMDLEPSIVARNNLSRQYRENEQANAARATPELPHG